LSLKRGWQISISNIVAWSVMSWNKKHNVIWQIRHAKKARMCQQVRNKKHSYNIKGSRAWNTYRNDAKIHNDIFISAIILMINVCSWHFYHSHRRKSWFTWEIATYSTLIYNSASCCAVCFITDDIVDF
jgi:hypothetical protein